MSLHRSASTHRDDSSDRMIVNKMKSCLRDTLCRVYTVSKACPTTLRAVYCSHWDAHFLNSAIGIICLKKNLEDAILVPSFLADKENDDFYNFLYLCISTHSLMKLLETLKAVINLKPARRKNFLEPSAVYSILVKIRRSKSPS